MVLSSSPLGGKDRIAQLAQDWLARLKGAGLIEDGAACEDAALEAASATAEALEVSTGSVGMRKTTLLRRHASRLVELISSPDLLGQSGSLEGLIAGCSALEDAVMRSLTENGSPEAETTLRIGELFGWVIAHASIVFLSGDAQEPHAAHIGRDAADAAGRNRIGYPADELLKLKEEFIAVASHELKTPLTSVKAYSQMVRRQIERQLADGSISREMAPDLHRIAGHLAVIDGQADRLCRLINEFLDISRLESGSFQMDTRIVDLTELTTRAIHVFEDIVESSRVNLSTYDKPILVRANADRMEQVIANILQNAHMYSPLGKPIEVSTGIVHCRETGKTWGEVCVKDYGIGITEVDLPHIFERFYHPSSAEGRHYYGIGIGLYISAQITRKHNGEIWATSKPRNGSTFGVRLPLIGLHSPTDSPVSC